VEDLREELSAMKAHLVRAAHGTPVEAIHLELAEARRDIAHLGGRLREYEASVGVVGLGEVVGAQDGMARELDAFRGELLSQQHTLSSQIDSISQMVDCQAKLELKTDSIESYIRHRPSERSLPPMMLTAPPQPAPVAADLLAAVNSAVEHRLRLSLDELRALPLVEQGMALRDLSARGEQGRNEVFRRLEAIEAGIMQQPRTSGSAEHQALVAGQSHKAVIDTVAPVLNRLDRLEKGLVDVQSEAARAASSLAKQCEAASAKAKQDLLAAFDRIEGIISQRDAENHREMSASRSECLDYASGRQSQTESEIERLRSHLSELTRTSGHDLHEMHRRVLGEAESMVQGMRAGIVEEIRMATAQQMNVSASKTLLSEVAALDALVNTPLTKAGRGLAGRLIN